MEENIKLKITEEIQKFDNAVVSERDICYNAFLQLTYVHNLPLEQSDVDEVYHELYFIEPVVEETPIVEELILE